MSPALAGRLLTTRLPGKSWTPGLMVVHLPIEEELTKLWGWDGEQRGRFQRGGGRVKEMNMEGN